MRDYRNSGKGWWHTIPDADTRFPALERDYAKAERPVKRLPIARRLVDGRQTYAAYDAHHLLESTDPTQLARPGHPLG